MPSPHRDDRPTRAQIPDLDGAARLSSKEERTLRVFQRRIPRLRLVWMLMLLGVVALHRYFLPSGAQGSLPIFAVACGLHVALGTLAVLRARDPQRVQAIGQVCLGLDLGLVLWSVAVTGGPRSLFFWLPIIRVADQSFMGVRWCLGFAHAAVLGLVLAFEVNHALGGMRVEWGLYGVQVGVLWAAGVYLSMASFQAERARLRTSRAMQVSRELIEQLQAQSEDLLESNRAAEAATAAKNMFLASMSHELRTPMNAILGMTHLTLEGDLEGPQREQLEIVNHSAESLLEILNDILDVSRLEAGKVELASLEVSPLEVVEPPLKALSLLAHERGLDLLLEVDPKLPATISCDPGRLRQVVTNLVGNAIKFTSAGHVLVRLQGGADQATLICEVIDTGKGIAPERLERIFEAFTQENELVAGEYGGTGLGLTISHKLVQRMGGSLHVESELERGSRFWFELPLDGSEDVLVERDERPLARVALDVTSEALRASLSRTLGRIGAELVEPAEFDAEPNTDDGALLLLVDDLSRIGDRRSVPSASSLRRILYLPRRTEALQSQPLGVAALVQPPGLHDLVGALRGEGDRAGRVNESGGADGEAARPLLLLVAEDNRVNQRVIESFLTRLGHTVLFANDGIEAVELSGTQPFDGIFMDVQMPRLDGVEATRRIRAALGGEDESPRARPWIVALTAGVLPSDRAVCFEAGMDAFLEKPVRVEELQRVIAEQTRNAGGVAGDRPAA